MDKITADQKQILYRLASSNRVTDTEYTALSNLLFVYEKQEMFDVGTKCTDEYGCSLLPRK